ncbi:transcriptional regulator [Tardiphaga sp. 839_C3_N1_4]|uniref:transcriptional regulator n=1 Tax=Tardiphaga sp. 839_C3_N1_4 TaxID=3240761 RepID=UPI003F26E14A
MNLLVTACFFCLVLASLGQMPISPAQSRAARGLLNWTLADIAQAASLGLSTVKNFESGLRATTPANLNTIYRAYVDAGVEFIAARNGKGVGVRLAADI